MDDQALAEACADVMYAEDRASQHMGMEIISMGPGQAMLRMTLKDWMMNGHGTCHGGVLFMFADSAFGFACNSRNNFAVAQMASITFIAPAHEGDTLTAEAREVTVYGRNGLYDIRVTNEKGALIAEFRGSSRQINGVYFESINDAAGK